MGSLLVRFDPTEAVALRSRPFEIAAGTGISVASYEEYVASITLRPGALSAAAERTGNSPVHVGGAFRGAPAMRQSFFCNTATGTGAIPSWAAKVTARCWAVVVTAWRLSSRKMVRKSPSKH